MTTHTITIDANVFTGDVDGREPVAVEFRAQAYRPAGWAVPLSPTEFAVKNLLVVEIDPDEPTIELEATGEGDWCWHVGVHHPDIDQPWERFFYVTADANFLDLVDLNPATLDPAVDPGPAWTLALEAETDARVAADTALSTALGLETTARQSADTLLQANINAEAVARAAADDALHTTITTETEAAIIAAVDALIDAAPGALNTFKELADALGDDPNFATTVLNALATKATPADITAAIATQHTADLSTFGPLGLPSYAAAVPVRPFDARQQTYNFKPTNTRKLRAALGRANAGGFCEILTIGDSIAAGCTASPATFDRLRAWPIALRDELLRHGLVMGGTGIVRITDANIASDARWGFTGVWSAVNKTFASISGAGTATLTNTSITTGPSGSYDRAVIYYYDFAGTGAFSITVKNQAGTTIGSDTVTETSAGWKRKVVNLAPAETGGGTILITRTAGSIAIAGASWYSTAGGLIVENIAQSSSRANGADGKVSWEVADANAASLCNVFAAPTRDGSSPDLLMVSLGINDIQAGVTAAQLKTALTTIRNRYASADCILVASNQPAESLVSAAAWEAYVVAMYELADTLDVPLIDFRSRLGNWATLVANGLNGDAVGHLTAGAYAGLGRSAGLLLAS